MFSGAIGLTGRHGAALAAVLALAAGAASAQTPAILPNGTVNAADYSRSFAPGALISIFGTNLAASTAQPAAFPLPTQLGGATVELASTGEQFPLWYVSPTQINAQMPYDVPEGQAQIRVRTAAGVSATDTITVSARAPKIFTLDFTGKGSAVATDTGYHILSTNIPAKPADTIVLWMNSMGATSGNPAAGQPAPGQASGSLPSIISGVTATVSGVNAPVTFAGLCPGSAGLYQVNVLVPFSVITGPVAVQVTVGGVSTQANVNVPYRQLGFYFSLLGGKAVPGDTQNGLSGSTSALAFRQADALSWGTAGLNAWTNNTGLGSQYSAVSGLAVTLKNSGTVVFDNNGIETGAAGKFYDNTGGGANSDKPGLTDLYSMSNYFPMVFAGHVKLAQAATVTELIGYFDTLGNLEVPFDPANGYVRYRMNIWSNASGTLPRETGNFTGDVFSTDTTAGTFSYSDTGIKIRSSVATDAPKTLWRLSFKPAQPLTLAAGDYWFSHDASVRSQPAAQSTSMAVSGETAEFLGPQAPAISADELTRYLEAQGVRDERPTKVWFYGREMTYRNSRTLPGAVTVRPSAILVH